MLQSMGLQRVREDLVTEQQQQTARDGVVLVPLSCLTLWIPTDWSATLLCPWNSPGNDTGTGCHSCL